MISSSYTSESLLLRQLQPTLGDIVWRPEMISNIPSPIVTILGDVVWILGDVVWRPEIISNDPSPIVTPGDRLAALVADEQRDALAIEWPAAKPDLKTVKAECMGRFGITDRGYQLRAWPAATGCDVLILAPEARAPVADEQPEDQATGWLAAKPDLKTVKRDHYKAECMERFGISGRAYQLRVYPAARQRAGLRKRAKPGPKKQIKKIIVTPIRGT